MVISFNEDYFGDNVEVWIICTWLGNFFDDDDFLVYTLEMMIVFIWDFYMRIYVNIIYLWWTCVIENVKVKGDDMLISEKRCDDVFMW